MGRYSTPEPCSTLRFRGPAVRRVFLVALLAGFTLCFAASSAQAYVYWTDNFGNTIGRANLDGSSPDRDFITAKFDPVGIAVDGAHVYWAHSAIGRANLDGTGANDAFIPGSQEPLWVAVDGAHVYWTNVFVGRDGSVGRANLDGTGSDESFVPSVGAGGGIAVDGAHVYWAGSPVGRANLDGSSPDQNFITGADERATALAVDGAHIYWTNRSARTIGRANLDGSSPDQNFITGLGSPYGIAVDGAHVYWTEPESNRIGRANVDGTAVNKRFIDDPDILDLPYGVAVDALGPPPDPVQGATVNAVPRTGTVSVRLPSGASVPLESLGQQIPVGSTLDTTKGTVRLSAATNASGGTQHGDFGGGLFNVTQGRKNPLTTLSMTGGDLGSCGKVPHGGSPKVAAARKRTRRLFSNVKGRFRTRGRNSAATVRGTKFTMTDTCAGTRTQVTAGTVLVQDFSKGRTVSVRAGHSYFARARNSR